MQDVELYRQLLGLDSPWAVRYFTGLSLGKRTQIRAVAMDMWDPYVQSVHAHVPQAGGKIVFDVFHILRHMNEAVDRLRRQEHRRLRAQRDETVTGSKYVWLYGEDNIPDHHQARFTELTRRGADRPLCARMSETVPPPEITEEGETG